MKSLTVNIILITNIYIYVYIYGTPEAAPGSVNVLGFGE